jgi:tRNA pseudouridine38-40 synthase
MERYQIILAYDGTGFHGSQYQSEIRTVQGVLQAVLRDLNWTGKSIWIAGRTDAGVHASGQVAAFDFDWNHSPADLKNALNALLPQDMAVFNVKAVRPDFHPRFDAVSRCYRYRIYCQLVRDPLRERFAWRVWPVPDLDRLRIAAGITRGIHDFAGFGRATSPNGSTIRNVMEMTWRSAANTADEFILDITANAFLYHMARRLVFAHVAVGQGLLEADELERHLDHPGPEPIQGLAPPQGLILKRVSYNSEQSENDMI